MSQVTTTTAAPPSIKGRSLWSDAVRRLTRDRFAMLCFGIIVIYALVAILSPLVLNRIYQNDTGETIKWQQHKDFSQSKQSPSRDHLLGTDLFGRSVLQKTFLAASTSLTVGFMANIIAVPLGMFLGVLAGYYGGWLDDLIVWLYTTLTCIPGIIRLIAIKFAFMDKSLNLGFTQVDLDGIAGLYIALGVMSWIGTCRLVRAETMRLRESDYILAARTCGTGGMGIMVRHIIPNVAHLGIINFSLGFVGAIKAEVILSFLGLGVDDRPSWGQMISAARIDLVVGRWWEFAAAVGAMFFIVLAWNIFGDRLRDALDPRLKNT